MKSIKIKFNILTPHWLRIVTFSLMCCTLFYCSSEDSPTQPKSTNFPPPPGESWTYRIVGTTFTFTNITEAVSEKIGGYVVYRIREINDPPGLGEYIGYDADHGEVEVATDSWDVNNPSNNKKLFWEPPLFRCSYGTPAGSSPCEWIGTFDGEFSRVVTEVMAYETVIVPAGTFENSMKVTSTEYDSTHIVDGPTILWVDKNIGIVKGQEVGSGSAIELISYTPSANKRAATSGVSSIYRNRLLGNSFWRSGFAP